jgi:hypothetical protein
MTGIVGANVAGGAMFGGKVGTWVGRLDGWQAISDNETAMHIKYRVIRICSFYLRTKVILRGATRG